MLNHLNKSESVFYKIWKVFISNNDLYEAFHLLPPILLGFLLRFYSLGRQPLFLDEAFTAHLISQPWKDMMNIILEDVHPPLYYVVVKCIMYFAPLSEFSLRLTSASFSLLSQISAIVLAYLLVGRRIAILTGWVLSWSALHIYYAQDARMYSMLDLWWIISTLCILWIIRRKKIYGWVIWAIFVILAIYTQFYGILLWGIGAFFGGGAILLSRNLKQFWGWMVAQICIAVSLLPLIPIFINAYGGGVGGTWIPSPSDLLDLVSLIFLGFPAVYSHFLNGELLVGNLSKIPILIYRVIAIVFTALAIVGWYKRKNKISVYSTLIMLFFVLIPLIFVTMWFWLFREPLWAYRPLIGLATLCIIWFIIGWELWLPPKIVNGLLMICFLINMIGLYRYYHYWVKDYARLAFNTLPPNSALLLEKYYVYVLFDFYNPQWTGDVFSLVYTSSGIFRIVRIDDFQFGHETSFQEVKCNKLPNKIAYYGSLENWLENDKRWSDCLRSKVKWIFVPEKRKWAKAK